MEILFLVLTVIASLLLVSIGDLLLTIFFRKLDEKVYPIALKLKDIKPLVLVKQLIAYKL